MITIFYICDEKRNKDCKKSSCSFYNRGYCIHTSDRSKSKYWKKHLPSAVEISEFFESVEGSNGFYWAEKVKLPRRLHMKRKHLSSIYES